MATDDRLVGLLLDLLRIPSTTGDEARLADDVAARLDASTAGVRRIGSSVVAARLDDARPLVLLVGHLDVVPPTDADVEPRADDERVVGRGSSDMKSGLAVALDAAADPRVRQGPWNVGVVAYAGEEGPDEGNELADVLVSVPELADAALAVVLEPTDLQVQLGCLGGLHAHVVVHGAAAHSARPWHGRNALTGAASLLSALDAAQPEERPVDGLDYRDVWTATQAWTDNARNVVPDRFTINVNYRFSPASDLEEAERRLRSRIASWAGQERVDVDVVDRAPPALPHREAPAVRAFAEAAAAPVAPKQAWTDVARLAQLGVPALNYGPGLTGQAHQAGEWVPRANLATARAALQRFLTTPRP